MAGCMVEEIYQLEMKQYSRLIVAITVKFIVAQSRTRIINVEELLHLLFYFCSKQNQDYNCRSMMIIYSCNYMYIFIEQSCRYNITVFILFEMELNQCGANFYLV